MAFYKREGEELLQAPTFVVGPGIDVSIENHSEHTYPIEGWYWFDTLDEAMKAMASPPDVQTVTALQALLAIDAMGMSAQYESWCADPSRTFAERAFIQRAERWTRVDATFNAAADALGKTESEKDQFFELASTL